MKCFAIMTSDEIDAPSLRGLFRWEIIGNSCVPCFVRSNGENYVSTRLASNRILRSFLQKFNNSFFSSFVLDSFAMTPIEIQLLEHINKDHCDGALTNRNFDVNTDFSVKLNDLRQLYEFVDACNKRLDPNANQQSATFGYIRIDFESVVPYITKDDVKYIPVFYFEGELNQLESFEVVVTGWDLAYIKFLCKIHGINASLYDVNELKVISLDVVRPYFGENTRFDDFWPTNIVNLDTTSKPENCTAPISWFKAPLKRRVKISPKLADSLKSRTITAMNGYTRQSPANADSVLLHRLAAPPSVQVVCTSSPSVIRRVYSPSNSVPTLTPKPHSSTATSVRTIAPLISTAPQTNDTAARTRLPQTSVCTNSVGQMNSTVAQPGRSHTSNRPILPYPSHESKSQSSASGSSTVAYTSFSNVATGAVTTPSNSSNVDTNRGRKRSRGTIQNDVIDLSTPPSSPNTELSTNTLIPIPDYRICSNSPYKTQIITFKEKRIFIINFKPDDFSEALVPLIDICKSFFNVSLSKLCDKLLGFPAIKLYVGNTIQKQILRDHNKCNGSDAGTPLMLYRDLDHYFDQIASIVRGKT